MVAGAFQRERQGEDQVYPKADFIDSEEQGMQTYKKLYSDSLQRKGNETEHQNQRGERLQKRGETGFGIQLELEQKQQTDRDGGKEKFLSSVVVVDIDCKKDIGAEGEEHRNAQIQITRL